MSATVWKDLQGTRHLFEQPGAVYSESQARYTVVRCGLEKEVSGHDLTRQEFAAAVEQLQRSPRGTQVACD